MLKYILLLHLCCVILWPWPLDYRVMSVDTQQKLTEEKYEVRSSLPEAAILVKTTTEPKLTLKITLTSPAMREDDGEEEEEEELEEEEQELENGEEGEEVVEGEVEEEEEDPESKNGQGRSIGIGKLFSVWPHPAHAQSIGLCVNYVYVIRKLHIFCQTRGLTS